MNHESLAMSVYDRSCDRRWETSGRTFATASNLRADYPTEREAQRFERDTTGLFRLRMVIWSYNTCVAVVATRTEWSGNVDTPELWLAAERHSVSTAAHLRVLRGPWLGFGAAYSTPVVGAHRGAGIPTEHRASQRWARWQFDALQEEARTVLNRRCAPSTRTRATHALCSADVFASDARAVPAMRLGYDLRTVIAPARAARVALSHLHSMLAADPLFPRDSAAFVEVAASLPQVRRLATMPCPFPSH